MLDAAIETPRKFQAQTGIRKISKLQKTLRIS